jgi:hypothetical protein
MTTRVFTVSAHHGHLVLTDNLGTTFTELSLGVFESQGDPAICDAVEVATASLRARLDVARGALAHIAFSGMDRATARNKAERIYNETADPEDKP